MTKTVNRAFLHIFTFPIALVLAMAFTYMPAHARDMSEFPRVKLQSLDKATARTMTFEAKVGSTLRFGPLYIRVQKCKKASPIDKPESAAFLQIWEIDTENKPQWVFSGWMFASSPGLSGMDHPIYDVWVLDCMDYEKAADPVVEEAESTPEEASPEEADKTKNSETSPFVKKAAE